MDGSYILLFFFSLSLYLINGCLIYTQREKTSSEVLRTRRKIAKREFFFFPTDLFDVKKDSLFLSSHRPRRRPRRGGAHKLPRNPRVRFYLHERAFRHHAHKSEGEFSKWEREKKKTEAKREEELSLFFGSLSTPLVDIFSLSRLTQKIILFCLLVYTHMRMICEN